MGTVVKFPEGRIVRFSRAETPAQSAMVIILPAVRIERQEDSAETGTAPDACPPGGRGGRRRMRRR
jgi:hypothetical protein